MVAPRPPRAAPLPPPAPSSPCARAPRRPRPRCRPRPSPARCPPRQPLPRQRQQWRRQPLQLRPWRPDGPRRRPPLDPAPPPLLTGLPPPPPRRHRAPWANPPPRLRSPPRSRAQPAATQRRSPQRRSGQPRRVRLCRCRHRVVRPRRPPQRPRGRTAPPSCLPAPALQPGRQPPPGRRRLSRPPLARHLAPPGPRPALSPAARHPGPRQMPRPRRHGPRLRPPPLHQGQPPTPRLHHHGRPLGPGPKPRAMLLGWSPAAPVRPLLLPPGPRSPRNRRLGQVRRRRRANPRPPERRSPAAPPCRVHPRAVVPKVDRALAAALGPMERPRADPASPTVPEVVVPNWSAGPNRGKAGNRDLPVPLDKPAAISHELARLGPSALRRPCPCDRARRPAGQPCRFAPALPPTAAAPVPAPPPVAPPPRR
jgi:hypothetical protein